MSEQRSEKVAGRVNSTLTGASDFEALFLAALLDCFHEPVRLAVCDPRLPNNSLISKSAFSAIIRCACQKFSLHANGRVPRAGADLAAKAGRGSHYPLLPKQVRYQAALRSARPFVAPQ